MRRPPDPLADVSAAMRPRLRCALDVLLEAFNFARVSERDPRELAVEIADLHAASVTNAALRLLVCNGLVEHVVEKTKAGNHRRRFSDSEELHFSDQSCFVLTEAGAHAARVPHAEPALSAAVTPYWNEAEHTLFWRGQAIKHYKSEAPYQEALLRAFQAGQWVRCVTVALPADPGIGPKERLHNTIQNLNRNVRPHFQFRQEGSGSRVCWEATGGLP